MFQAIDAFFRVIAAVGICAAVSACSPTANESGSSSSNAEATAAANPALSDQAKQRSGNGGIDFAGPQLDSPQVGRFVALSSQQTLHVTGWAYDDPHQARCKSVILVVGRSKIFPAHYGLDRSDVAAHFHDASLQDVGYTAAIQASSLGMGTHDVEVVCVSDVDATREPVRKLHVIVH